MSAQQTYFQNSYLAHPLGPPHVRMDHPISNAGNNCFEYPIKQKTLYKIQDMPISNDLKITMQSNLKKQLQTRCELPDQVVQQSIEDLQAAGIF